MSDANGKLHIELGPDPEGIIMALSALARFSDAHHVPTATAQAAELALDELLTNCITHGKLDPLRGRISLDLDMQGTCLQITVSDNGPPFDPCSVPKPDLETSIDERRTGGVGIHLVKNFTDSFDYERVGDENVVTLRCKLKIA